MKPSKNFYQWDINQKFTECDGRFVDFIINEKVVYRVNIVNGECIVPDEFYKRVAIIRFTNVCRITPSKIICFRYILVKSHRVMCIPQQKS